MLLCALLSVSVQKDDRPRVVTSCKMFHILANNVDGSRPRLPRCLEPLKHRPLVLKPKLKRLSSSNLAKSIRQKDNNGKRGRQKKLKSVKKTASDSTARPTINSHVDKVRQFLVRSYMTDLE